MLKHCSEPPGGNPSLALLIAKKSTPLLAISALLLSQLGQAATLTVTENNDPASGLDDNECSLREAINSINAQTLDAVDCPNTGAAFGTNDTILFDASITGDTITASGSPFPAISRPLTITGPTAGDPAGITLSGGGNYRTLNVSSMGDFALNNLTITGGQATGQEGGGLYALNASVTGTDIVVTNNTAANNGGGIASRGPDSDLTLVRSTVSGNNAGGDGGGIFANYNVSLTDSTISGNTASDYGGGIRAVTGDVTAVNSTISGNTLTGAGTVNGGGISAAEGVLDLNHVTLADNDAGTGSVIDPAAAFMGASVFVMNNSIVAPIGGNTCARMLDAGTNNLFTDVNCDGISTPRDGSGGINLISLADNGGPTQTHALCITAALPAGCLDASAALNTAAAGLNADQRGIPRPQAANNDIGAFESTGLDFGDAPDTYFTLQASGGPSHVIDPNGPMLGTRIDAENDGQPDPDALGDDLAGTDDEDSVLAVSQLIPGELGSVDIFVTLPSGAVGNLDAWIDFDGNGVFDATDQVATSEPMIAGTNQIDFTIPAAATLGRSFARIRISTAGGLAPGGLAVDGEIEDFPTFIGAITGSRGGRSLQDDDEENCGTRALIFCIGGTGPRELLLLLPLVFAGFWRKIRAVRSGRQSS